MNSTTIPGPIEYRIVPVADCARSEPRDLLSTPTPNPPAAPISRERRQLADAGIDHLSPILRQLLELRDGPENDDYGRLQPTQHAYNTTVELLVDAAIDAQSERRQIPHGCVSTDSEGGVRIEWIREEASVHLVVPAEQSKAPYVYHEVGGKYATEEATPRCLSYWLRAVS